MFSFIVFDFAFRLTTNQGNFNLKKNILLKRSPKL